MSIYFFTVHPPTERSRKLLIRALICQMITTIITVTVTVTITITITVTITITITVTITIMERPPAILFPRIPVPM